MLQIYWLGWQERKWGFSKGKGYNDQGIKQLWTLDAGVVQFSGWHVARFNEAGDVKQPAKYARPWKVKPPGIT